MPETSGEDYQGWGAAASEVLDSYKGDVDFKPASALFLVICSWITANTQLLDSCLL